MSLKGFHIFFIGVATACSLGFGVWLLIVGEPGLGTLAGGAASFLVAAALVIYGIRFLKKTRHLSSM